MHFKHSFHHSMCFLSLVIFSEVPGKALLGMELHGQSRDQSQDGESPERIPEAMENTGQLSTNSI